MPVIVNVGLSRKTSRDYQSHGYSLNITSELPAMAIEDPNAMARAAENLFQLAEDLIEEQVRKAEGQSSPSQPRTSERRPYRDSLPQQPLSPAAPQNRPRQNNGRDSNRGRSYAGGNGQSRGITEAQKRAIGNMANRLGVAPEQASQDEFGVPMAGLTIKQASELIDVLKDQIESTSAQGAGR